MKQPVTYLVDDDAAVADWDERRLGADPEHAQVASDISQELDAALELHPISIRLQKSLVENLKHLAVLHGLGYQPLIRQILTRWVECEAKQMLAQQANAQLAEANVAPAAGRAAVRTRHAPPTAKKAA